MPPYQPPVEGSFDRVRLHVLVEPAGSAGLSSAWIMQLADVDWRPPNDWPVEIEGALSSHGATSTVTFDLSVDGGSALDIVARTDEGLAQVITDRHHLASMLEAWAQARLDASDPDSSIDEARRALLFALESHFGTSEDAVDRIEIEYEPGNEYSAHVDAGTDRYVGTVGRRGRMLLVHVVDRSER